MQQAYNDIKIECRRRSGWADLSVWRSGGGGAAVTPSGSESLVGTLPEGYRPVKEHNCFCGVGTGGAWLFARVMPDGRVSLHHVYGGGSAQSWDQFTANFAYPLA